MTSSSKSRRLLSHIWIWVTYSMIHTVWKRDEKWDCSDVGKICWLCYMAHVGNTENSAKSKLWPLSLAVGPLIETVSLAQQTYVHFSIWHARHILECAFIKKFWKICPTFQTVQFRGNQLAWRQRCWDTSSRLTSLIAVFDYQNFSRKWFDLYRWM